MTSARNDVRSALLYLEVRLNGSFTVGLRPGNPRSFTASFGVVSVAQHHLVRSLHDAELDVRNKKLPVSALRKLPDPRRWESISGFPATLRPSPVRITTRRGPFTRVEWDRLPARAA